MWIHQHPLWPQFTWDAEALTTTLSHTRHQQGILLGKMEGLGFDLKREASLETLTSDVVKSSAIEGEELNPEEVRSSIAKRLGIDIAGLPTSNKHTDAVVDMMLDATQNYTKTLTKERLFDWHAALFPTGRNLMQPITVGNWRLPANDPMRVVSGAIGHEKTHFEAPSANKINHEMTAFLEWFESDNKTAVDPVIKAGIAHLWFVTIHPFEDGNGRIARAIADMALARADGIANRFYGLSTQIEAERKTYYDQLESQQRGSPDITEWLSWFLDCLARSIAKAEQTLESVIFKSQLWSFINMQAINDRQRIVINRMLEKGFEGYLNTSKYAKLAKCSSDSALRDIQMLKERGILIQNSEGGRSTSYRLLDKIEK